RGDGPEARVDPVARKADLWEWLALERVVPHPRLVQPVEHVAEVPHGKLGQPRLVCRPRPSLENGARVVAPRSGEEEREVSRHVEEACRRWQHRSAYVSPHASAGPARRAALRPGL